MSIVTISTVLTDSAQIESQLDGAVGVARAADAHLHILGLAVLMEQMSMVHTALDGVPTGMDMDASIEKLKAMVADVQQKMGPQGLRWNMDATTAAPSAFGSEVARLTRFSDLVVHQRGNAHDSAAHTKLLAEAVLFTADTPILLLPQGGSLSAPPARPLIAWDDSPAALRAARQALPLFAPDAQADVVMIGAGPNGAEKPDPGGDFAQFLSRHGVRCETSLTSAEGESVAAALQRRALELGSDMLVMGAYGHSRLRQAIFGGTTRDLINEAALPVLMAH